MLSLVRTEVTLLALAACFVPFGELCIPPALCSLQEEANVTLSPGLNLALSVDFGNFRVPDPERIALFNSSSELCEPDVYSVGVPCQYVAIRQISVGIFDTIVECRDTRSLLLPSGTVVIAFHMKTVNTLIDMDCEVVKTVDWIQTRKFCCQWHLVSMMCSSVMRSNRQLPCSILQICV